MQTLLGYLALSSNFGGFRDSRLSQNDSAVKIKQDFLGVIFCCPMEIVPPQMKMTIPNFLNRLLDSPILVRST